MQSNQGTLNKEDFKQLGIKLVMVAVAAIMPVLIQSLLQMNLGQYQWIVSVLICIATFMTQYTGQRLARG